MISIGIDKSFSKKPSAIYLKEKQAKAQKKAAFNPKVKRGNIF